MNAERLYKAITDKGYEPHSGTKGPDVRDAVHEAAHAISFGLDAPWTRARIDRAAGREPREKFRQEALARAVEQLVCERLGVEIDPLDMRAATAALEAIKLDRYSAPLEAWVRVIESFCQRPVALELADKVLALASAET